jgi:hypothetical protein
MELENGGPVSSNDKIAATFHPHITAKGQAVVESGLTVRQAHEIETGCSEHAPCPACREDVPTRPIRDADDLEFKDYEDVPLPFPEGS